MNKEEFFISTFDSGVIGDDGALVDNLIYSSDLFFENIHYKRSWMSLYQIGYKAMMVNISDAIAMNAKPLYAILGVAIPKNMRRSELEELSRGLKEAAKKYDVAIIGGDTIANTKLDISITIVSRSENPLTRYGLKVGDIIAYTGKVGDSKKELGYLFAGAKLHSKSRFISPTIRGDFIAKSRRHLRAGMDISDGLFSDIRKLTSLNRLGAKLIKSVPRNIGCSGEEYEMLVAFAPREYEAIKKVALKTRTPLTPIARVTRGSTIKICKPNHF